MSVIKKAETNPKIRNKNLGSTVTDAQWNAIKNGTFDDMHIGDFWFINGTQWIIAHFDYYYNTGEVADNRYVTNHHLTLIPAFLLYSHRMNPTDDTTGAYVGSEMYTSNLDQAKELIYNAFGQNHVLRHRQYFPNAITKVDDATIAYESDGAWYDADVYLMSEANVYGSNRFAPSRDTVNTDINQQSLDCRQYALFTYSKVGYTRYSYWLRNVASAHYFAGVNALGNSNQYDASAASHYHGVRPAFNIYAP